MKIKNPTYLFALAFSLVLINTSAQEADVVRLENIVTELADDSYLGRGFGTEQGKQAAAYIISEFEKSGVEPFLDGWLHSFNHRQSSLNIGGNNVVGVVRGSDPDLADEYIVVGGHYDHVGWKLVDGDTVVYNGADDNASGVAGVIELGRMLTENRDKLGRSVILMAFDGEETGLIGSNAFVKEIVLGENSKLDAAQIVAMFSLDMLGMYDTHGGVDILGIEMLTDYETILEKASEKAPIEIVKMNGALQNRTDTQPFGNAGIPSVHIWTSTESPYHKPEDDSDLLEYDGMGTIVDFVYALTGELSTIEEIDAKGMEPGSDAKAKVFNPGVTLDIGGSHFDYKDHWAKAHGVFSYAAGLSFQTRIGDVISLQPELLYEWGGSQIETGTINTHAVLVPVSLLLATPDQSGFGVRAFYQIGGYYRYVFDSNDASFDMNYAGTDYGIILGAGMEVMNFRIGYMFRQSLIDMTLGDGLDARLKGSFVKIGWVF